MIRIQSDRQIAFCDIDGVIVQNPAAAQLGKTITDVSFWEHHWDDPNSGQLNDEMITLVQSLISTGWHVIFLTARPERFYEQTFALLRRAGFFVSRDLLITKMSNKSKLILLPGKDIPMSSAEWKQSVVRKAMELGGNVKLMIEDYRGNSEAIRPLVPVLLYERKKVSATLPMLPCCGGLSRCWCPITA
jgi:hypothetical protein